MNPSITYLLVLFVLGILFPINGILSGRRVKTFISENPNGRLAFYQQTVMIQVILTAMVIGVMAYNQDSIAKIGLSFLMQPYLVIGLLVACLLGWWGMINVRFDRQKLIRDSEKNAAITFLLPSTEQEYRWSISASFAAGISEEIVFRGFLYWQLALILPLIPAILITNLIFGLCHFGTGLKNALEVFFLGIFLSIVYIYTESLWIPILIHVLTDIYSMTKGKRFFDLNQVK